jgi:hypothetical protein
MLRGVILKAPAAQWGSVGIVSKAQRAVLERILERPEHRPWFSYGGENHWYFNGRSVFVHATVAWSLRDRGWIRALPRLADQPYWREDYVITDEGRAALTRPTQPARGTRGARWRAEGNGR